ncbi:MAG: acyl-CoA thioesterase [Anaerolineae bacterium]
MDDDLTPKPPSASVAQSVNLAFPNDANVHGTVFGGRVMSWIDEIGALAAMRHARKPVVTALIDAVAFCVPVRVGDFAVVQALVTRAWTTSMEVWVTVHTENPFEDTRQTAAEAFLTFVAVDHDGKPQPVRPVVPETPEEHARFEEAQARRDHRLAVRRR